MMKKILFFLLLINCSVSAQKTKSDSTIQVISDAYGYSWNIGGMIDRDTLFVWKKQSAAHKEFHSNEFQHVKHLIEKQTKYAGVFDNSVCAVYASVDYLNYYIEVYEIGFDYAFQRKKFLKAVKKYKVDTLNWPDTSQPVCFFSSGSSIFICLDSSDNPDSKQFAFVANYLKSLE